MEDVRKRIDYLIVTEDDKLQTLVSDPLFIDHDKFSPLVVGVHMFKATITLDKPIFVGQAVLDYSKLEMYNLYYNVLRKCPLIRQPELLGGDTDSFFLAFHTTQEVSLNDIFRYLRAYHDSSNYPQDHPLYSTANKARLGCFKDEAGGRAIAEMILLRPKMYSIRYVDERDTDIGGVRRAKGLSKQLVRAMSHAEYRRAYETKAQSYVQMTILRSHLHSVNTVKMRKRGLSAWDDKRCWLEANFSVPHGSSCSGLPPPKRRRVVLPPSGDIFEASDHGSTLTEEGDE